MTFVSISLIHQDSVQHLLIVLLYLTKTFDEKKKENLFENIYRDLFGIAPVNLFCSASEVNFVATQQPT